MTTADDPTNIGVVTPLRSAPVAIAPAADAAVLAADAAARDAGVQVRELSSLESLQAAHALCNSIWRPDPENPPVTTELLRALSKAGNYVAGAYCGGELVGTCAGFFGAPAQEVMHSHIAGVSPAVRGRNVGFALKLHQRAWALMRGVSAITWTFDPLVRRNAYFNLAKLAVSAAEYLPNFYGGMRDAINGDDESDRLLVRWDLTAPAVAEACVGVAVPAAADEELRRGAVIALRAGPRGLPVAGTLSGDRFLVAVPDDVENLRASAAVLAGEWRIAVRETLTTLVAEGGRITAFDPAGWYVVARHMPRSRERETP